MNTLLSLGLLLFAGYLTGRIFKSLGLPKIIGYILVGILFSPNSLHWLEPELLEDTEVLLAFCLSFITFEVGGELKWKAIREHEREIFNITVWASLLPFLLIGGGFVAAFLLFPEWFPGFTDLNTFLVFALLLGALASPTDPTATLAVMHEYQAKGKVKDTILGVAALDDGLGILFFSFAITGAFILMGHSENHGATIGHALIHIGGGILTGILAAALMCLLFRILLIKGDGQWIVFIFSLITLCAGTALYFGFDELLACMTMGMVIANRCHKQELVFLIITRYTEELVFLVFFLLCGLRLNIQHMLPALLPILLFVVLRTVGKYGGSYLGAALAKADPAIRKHTAGGLIAQGGIVIGLALVVHQYEGFNGLADQLLAVVMGATVIHELIGPLTARRSILRAGEAKRSLPEKHA